MKDYQQVVSDRFDQELENQKSIYDADQPIGKYIGKSLFRELGLFLDYYSTNYGPVRNKKLLDLGCGNGGMIEFFIKRGFQANQISGIDLSNTRILRAQKQIPGAHFYTCDAINFSLDEKKFEIITAFDLFSHFNTKEQIDQGLLNIRSHLGENGLFLWYDIYSLDHFSPNANADAWGYNKEQIISFASEAGFKLIYYKPLFKFFFNRYQSVYQVRRFPAWIVRFLEFILGGNPGNMMFVFAKK